MNTKIMNCIMCPIGCEMTVTLDDNGKFVSVTGNTCPRGAKYAESEISSPKRMFTGTVRIEGGILPLLPVVTSDVIPKDKIMECASMLRNVEVEAPIHTGQVIVSDLFGTGVNLIASREMEHL